MLQVAAKHAAGNDGKHGEHSRKQSGLLCAVHSAKLGQQIGWLGGQVSQDVTRA